MAMPRKYDRAELVPKICARLEEGEPLAVILRDMGIPWRTVYDWRETDEAIAERFNEARDVGYDVIAQRIRDVAAGRHRPENVKDTFTLVNRDKLMVETDLKLLAKWDPRRYGERTTVDLNGSLGVHQEIDEERAKVVLKEALMALEGPGTKA